MKAVRKIKAYIGELSLALGGLALAATVVTACLDVISRLIGSPFAGMNELTVLFAAWTVALPAAYAQTKGGYAASAVLTSKFPTRFRRVVNAVALLLGALFFAILCRRMGAYADLLGMTGEASPKLKVEYFPFAYGIAVGFGLMLFALLADLLALFTDNEGKTS
ncbi:MAG: TRAP transporter small permease [Pseudomonadota bacterium]